MILNTLTSKGSNKFIYFYPFIEKVMINKTIEKFLKPEKNTSI